MKVLERPLRAEGTAPGVPEAIIPEARRRGRRRKAFLAVAGVATAGAVVAVAVVGLRDGSVVPTRPPPPLVRGAPSGSGRVPAVVVAWADYVGVLHLGDLATRRQMRIATLPVRRSPSGGPMVEDRGLLVWSDGEGKVRSVDIATGQATVVTGGTAVMASPHGDRLYADQGSTDVLELDARTLQVTRRLALPAGWTANPFLARPIAGGLILSRTGTPRGGSGPPLLLGVWRPGSKVRPLGAANGLPLDVYTPPEGRYSLVAWVPKCAKHNRPLGSGCPLAITNTATRRTVTVPSPKGDGFTGGAFSPDGTELATFVNTDNPVDPYRPARSELAVVDTTTGGLRLDPKVDMVTTEDAAWARWLPTGRQLLTGAISATYLVDAGSLATHPLYFDAADTRLQSIMNSPDLNFSTLVVPTSALSSKEQKRLGIIKASTRSG